MPRHTKKTRTSDDKGPRSRSAGRTRAKKAKDVAAERDRQDERNKAKFVGEPGVVAQDLPDAKHGMNVVDSPKQMKRKLPQEVGGEIGEHAPGGLRGDRNIQPRLIRGSGFPS